MTKPLGCWCLDEDHKALTVLTLLAKREIDPETGCWLWTGRLQSPSRANGGCGDYGVISLHGQEHYVHRLMWAAVHGAIPEGKEIDHVCRVRRCFNPSRRHTEPVTHQVNMLRGNGASGRHARRTHCANGHPFDQVVYRSNGVAQRRCSRCHVATNLASRRRRREKGGCTDD